jgi:hypothetical protein
VGIASRPRAPAAAASRAFREWRFAVSDAKRGGETAYVEASRSRRLRVLRGTFRAWARSRVSAARRVREVCEVCEFHEGREGRDAFLSASSAFAAWSALVAHRRVVRKRFAARSSLKKSFTRITSSVSGAWRAWRGRSALGRALTRMRHRSLARFLWPFVSSWRAVALAALRDETVCDLKLAAHARNVAWRAWRCWALGAVSAARLAAGSRAPAPAIPEGSSLGSVLRYGEGTLHALGLSVWTVHRKGGVLRRGGFAFDPAGRPRNGNAFVLAGNAARFLVLGRATLEAWRAAVAATEKSVPGPADDAAEVRDFVTRVEEEAAAAAAAEESIREEKERDAGSVAASELSEVPPIAAMDPEVYAAARREWLRREGGRGHRYHS